MSIRRAFYTLQVASSFVTDRLLALMERDGRANYAACYSYHCKLIRRPLKFKLKLRENAKTEKSFKILINSLQGISCPLKPKTNSQIPTFTDFVRVGIHNCC